MSCFVLDYLKLIKIWAASESFIWAATCSEASVLFCACGDGSLLGWYTLGRAWKHQGQQLLPLWRCAWGVCRGVLLHNLIATSFFLRESCSMFFEDLNMIRLIVVKHLHINVLYQQKIQWLPGSDTCGFSNTSWLMAHKIINYILQVAASDARGIESIGVWMSFPSFSTHLWDVYATTDHKFVFHPVNTLISKPFSEWLLGSLIMSWVIFLFQGCFLAEKLWLRSC